jgi:hypothetical protein
VVVVVLVLLEQRLVALAGQVDVLLVAVVVVVLVPAHAVHQALEGMDLF